MIEKDKKTVKDSNRVQTDTVKKGYAIKGGGADKEYVSIFDVNTRSSKN